MITTRLLQRVLPVCIITLATLISIGYSLGPLFEGSDERQHYYYIRYLADKGELPDVFFLPSPELGAEMFQPPLYYVLGVPIKRAINDTDFDEIVNHKNIYKATPSRLFGSDPPVPPGNDNKNFLLHSRREAFPYAGSPTALAAHLIRLISALMSTLMLVACWQIFGLLWPEHPHRQWLALGVAAFWPLRAYMGGVINNDNAANMMSAVSLVLILRQYLKGPSRVQAGLLGLSLGLTVLSKENGLLLAAPLGVMWLFDFRRQLKFIPLTVLAAVAVAGWWFLRNWIYYGVITSFTIQPMYIGVGSQLIGSGRLVLAQLPDRLLLIAQHFWGNVGHDGLVPLSPELSALSGAIIWPGLAGAAWGGIRWVIANRGQADARRVWVVAAILGVYMAAIIVGLSYLIMVNLYAVQPRFLIPGVAIMAAIFAFGWDSLIPARFKQRAALSVIAVLAAVGTLGLLACYIPAYRPLGKPTQIEHRVDIRFEDTVFLLGVSKDTFHVRPGESFEVRLYWAAIQPALNDLGVFVRLNDTSIVAPLSYPGNGNLLSTDWQPGEQWTEHYSLYVPKGTEPGTYELQVNVVEPLSIHFIDAFKRDGTPLLIPVVAKVIVEPP